MDIKKALNSMSALRVLLCDLLNWEVDGLLGLDILKRYTLHNATRSSPNLYQVATFAEVASAFDCTGFFEQINRTPADGAFNFARFGSD